MKNARFSKDADVEMNDATHLIRLADVYDGNFDVH